MTNRELAIMSAFTGISFGGPHFNHFHKYAEEKFGHPVWTHEMASQEWWDELKKLCYDDVVKLVEGATDD